MDYIFLTLFLVCVFIPAYSYVIFPFYLKFSTKNIARIKNNYDSISDWPPVTIVFSVFNEDKVMHRKLESILNSDYPKNKLQILIGSDNSTDQTHAIIEDFMSRNSNITLIKKNSQHGKLKVINELVDLTETQHLIFTDANVFFEPKTVKALVYNLIVNDAKLVGGNILKFSPKNKGISDQEIFYMNFENQLKYNESVKYGFCVGVEGGCYAILKSDFTKVPNGFLMDDFFITLSVIEKKGKVLFEPDAICYEDVNDEPLIEFKRKIRISLGNFRNLKYYKHLLFTDYNGFGFAFISHKVFRWITPMAIIISFFLSFLLSFYFSIFILMSLCYALLFILPVLTIYLEKINIKMPLINALGHFLLMNFALLIGFVRFCSATNTSSWEPPKRNV